MTCRLLGSGLFLMMIMDFHHKGWSYIEMNMVLQCLAVSQRSVILQGQCISWLKINSTLAWMWIAVYCLLFGRPRMMWEWHFPLTMWCCRVNAIFDFGISFSKLQFWSTSSTANCMNLWTQYSVQLQNCAQMFAPVCRSCRICNYVVTKNLKPKT